MAPQMRVALGQFAVLDDEKIKFCKQLGIDSVLLNTLSLPDIGYWEYEDLLALRLRCEEHGLTLEGIENVPHHWMLKIMLGLEGRDEEIRNYQTTIRNLGKAGIPILGHHFMPDGTWRTSYTFPLRGGARGMGFDLDLVSADRLDWSGDLVKARDPAFKDYFFSLVQEEPVSTERMWDNYAYFIRAVAPVAEEAGVKLALHPDDPPVPMLGGRGRLFISVDAFRKAMEIADSPAWGINFCVGSTSSMVGGAANVYEMIDMFGPLGKFVYGHFRDVQGHSVKFNECFLGEGNLDVVDVLRKLKQIGFTSFLIDDHVPWVDYDDAFGHRSHAHQSGYLQGMIAALG